MEKIKDLYLHPTFLAKYVKDGFAKIIAFLILAILVANSVTFLDYAKDNSLSYSSYINEVTELQSSGENVSYINGVLSGDGFQFDTVSIQFIVNEPEAVVDQSKLVVRYYSDYYTISVAGYVFETNSLIDVIGANDFTTSGVITKERADLDNFYSFVNIPYESLSNILIPVTYISGVIFDIISCAFIYLMLTLLLRGANKALPSFIREKLCLLSLNIYILFIFFGLLFGSVMFRYVGFMLAYLYAFRSLRSIISISVNKNKENKIDE